MERYHSILPCYINCLSGSLTAVHSNDLVVLVGNLQIVITTRSKAMCIGNGFQNNQIDLREKNAFDCFNASYNLPDIKIEDMVTL